MQLRRSKKTNSTEIWGCKTIYHVSTLRVIQNKELADVSFG